MTNVRKKVVHEFGKGKKEWLSNARQTFNDEFLKALLLLLVEFEFREKICVN
jgi:hypothetical protein